ncbi:ammonium transporter [Methylobacterium haplocladii]|uniref:Ammonium transporter n=1 Tax=Methylobacterium haplocladii TaxID=1176176 RepID=A0A512ILP4_9HYPH|nr:ammonium transporter [Methylobacterium haplocladii]GEO98595.1 ammonium transporter [Methylobacterium haplocladii]GJD84005.1 Ammonia channel [Methylobacterium haplocladii]GLS59237.1 ammonium transporter [Methylobacterium haplocladii]
MRRLALCGSTCFGLMMLAQPALAAPVIDTGHTAWILTASALVLFMTLPGLALFYAGLVHARNVLSVLMQCFAICCVASVLWAICGYSLVFDGNGALIGGLGKVFLSGLDAVRTPTLLPESAFALYQMTFAVITPALIIGAFPERVTFPFVVLFSALWLMLVYVPVAHWIWGGGWMFGLGVLDFAGGIVVHTTAGIAALVLAVMIGKRRGFPAQMTPPHSPGMTMAGAGMLWVGWFGFNGGSALASDGSAANAILATHLSAAAGAIAWTAAEWIKIRKPTSIGIVTGAVAGLATITPAAGMVAPGAGLLIGFAGGIVCFYATLHVKQRLQIDDSLDVFAVHGVGGMLGSLLLAFFALPELGGVGLGESGNVWTQLGVQTLAIVVTILWSGAVTYGLTRAIGLLTPIRVDAEAEYEGLDIASHGERAYEYN